MKKVVMNIVLGMTILSTPALISCNDSDDITEQIIAYDALPQDAKSYIAAHFPGTNTVRIEKNKVPEFDGVVYEVNLSNGVEIDFDINGVMLGIDGNNTKLPDSVIPQAILQYVTANYPNAFINDIEVKNYGYKIELNNDLDLRFDSEGNFVGIDY